MVMTIEKRENELATYLAKQPYITELDGMSLEIAKNVFPSDFGITSSFVGRYILTQDPVDNALDMACGSGYFAFLLKQIGCRSVLGVDFNKDAIACAKSNLMRNAFLEPIDFIHSDLFVNVPARTFGLIVFNFNYYPSNGLYGLNADGGNEILRRFFTQVHSYVDRQTRIYIPYSYFVGAENDPKNICPEFGFLAEVVAATTNLAGEHVIYRLSLV